MRDPLVFRTITMVVYLRSCRLLTGFRAPNEPGKVAAAWLAATENAPAAPSGSILRDGHEYRKASIRHR
jgi:hypothetical protein